jgi:hypothetical protein
MVRRDGAEIRKERMQEVARLIHRTLANEKQVSLSKTLALLQYEFGLTKEKLMEYFTVLESLGQFVVEKERDRIRRISESHE